MRIVQLKRVEKSIYEFTYVNFWGRKKVSKIFPYLFGWRYCNTGKIVPHYISVSIGNIAEGMQIGDLKIL